MTLIVTLYFTLVLLISVLVYNAPMWFPVKVMNVIMLTLIGILTYEHYKDNLGAPIQGYPSGEFRYVHHEVVGANISLWADTNDKGNRLYVLPYSQKVAEELQEAQEEGSPQGGSFEPSADGLGSPGLELDDWVGPNERMEK